MLQNIKNKQQNPSTPTIINHPPQHHPYPHIIPSSHSTSNLQINHRHQIFKPSQSQLPNPSLAQTSMPCIPGIKNGSQQQLHKIMCMMRQQIQISSNFYVKKMQNIIKEQAKEICELRNVLESNQKQLAKKGNAIEKMRETPKKKISIVSNQTNQLFSAEKEKQINSKISQLQARIENLQSNIKQKCEIQQKLNVKIQSCEKGMVKYLAAKLSACNKKLQQYITKKQKQLQKLLELDPISLKSPPVAPSSSSNQPLLHLQTKQNRLHKQLKQLRRQISQIISKQYKYDNYQVQKLKQEFNGIKKMVHLLESKIMIKNGKQKEKQDRRNYESEKLIVFNDGNKNGLRKEIRSQKAIQLPQQQFMAYTSANFRSTNNQQLRYNLTNTNLLNISTPPLTRNYSEQFINNPRQSPPVHIPLAKNCSTSPTPNINKSKNSTQSSLIKNKPQSLQKQFYEQAQNQEEKESSECLSYDQSFCSEEYEEEGDAGEEQNQEELMDRLVNTFKQQRLGMPVLVEIDQTGCLKCVQTGMYLVDSNSDVFYLGQQQLINFSKKGIIRVTH